jgi:hypothetical protein
MLFQIAGNFSGLPLDPFIALSNQLFGVLSTFLGGLFGLYLIFFLLKFLAERRMLKELREIKRDVRLLREKLVKR